MLEQTARLVAHRPRTTFLVLVVLTALAGLAMMSFRIEPNLEKSLPADHRGVELRRLVESEDDTQRTLLIAIEGDPIETLVADAVAQLEQSDFLEQVTATKEEFVGAWAAEFQRSPLSAIPSTALETLAKRLTVERRSVIESLPARIAEDPFVGLELARRDPLGVRWLFDAASRDTLPESLRSDSPYLVLRDGRTAFIRVYGREKSFDMDFSRSLVADVTARMESLRPELTDFRLIGSYASAQQDAARITDDLFRSCFWAITLIALFLTISTRRFLDPPILLFPTSIVMLWTMAFGSWFFGPITPLATSALPVLSGLSVDIAIHYLGRYRRERARMSAPEATVQTARTIGPPLLAGALTSIAAFASLMLTRFEGFQTFGLLLALGLAFAFLATLTMLPLLLWRTRGFPDIGADEPPAKTTPGAVISLAHRVVDSKARGPVLAVVLLLAVGGWLGVGMNGIRFDADPRLLRPANDPIAESTQWLEAALGFSPIPITLLVPSSVPVESCANALRSLEETSGVQFSLGVHRTVATGKKREDIAAFRAEVAGWRAAADQDFDRAELRPEAFADALDSLDQALSQDAVPDTALTQLSWRGTDYWRFTLFPDHTLWLTEDRAALRNAVRDSLGEAGPDAELVAPFGLADDMTDLLTEDLLRSAGLAAIAVIVLAFLFSGGFRFGLLALLPTATALGITLGGMALFDFPIHLGNLVAVPFLIGLGIDDGIHMVSRHREGVTTQELLNSSGHSVWRTSMTTLLGFGSLAFASSPGLASLGWVMTVGIAACFLTSILTLPILMKMSFFRANEK